MLSSIQPCLQKVNPEKRSKATKSEAKNKKNKNATSLSQDKVFYPGILQVYKPTALP